MSLESLLDVFDAWEPLLKARKAKGLAKWDKLSHMAEKLKGKKAADITFTTCYPGSEGAKKTLGSIEGNLHFLLGYGNPAFHLAEYHWQILDPNLTPEDALVLHKTKGHPSRPELWERSGLEMKDEGDQIDGQPHPAVADVREIEKVKTARKAESITVSSGAGSYTGIPSEGMVYGNHNKQTYAWAMIKDSFFAAANPDFCDKMTETAEANQAIEESIARSLDIPELVKHIASKHSSGVFYQTVYPLVKSHFPKPGSIVPIESDTRETMYGVMTSTALDFYDREGCRVNILVYDMPFTSFDLTKGGNLYSSVIKSFGTKYFGLPADLDQYVVEDTTIPATTMLEGTATVGFESVGDEYQEVSSMSKTVVMDGDTFRLVMDE